MFQSLSSKLTGILDKLKSRGALTEADVIAALREVRVALLEADVALPVVKQFIAAVREKAVGQDIIRNINPGQMVVKIVHDHLQEMLGDGAENLNLAAVPPAVILMVGLQGSGKTTSSGKLAKYITNSLKKKVLLASLDVYRPAAQQQLETVGKQISIATLPIISTEKPLEITNRALQMAKSQGFDVLILDTAGRLHIDETLMEELVAIKAASNPIETLLIADAMTGQDAVTIAQEFNEKIGVTGIVLTRLDGDARGGAALSMRAITGRPIKFMGVGEKLDQIEPFQANRVAGRILDMGDIVSLVEKAASVVDQEEAELMAKKIQKGSFDLNDMAKQIESMMKMGGMSSLLGMLPGVGRLKDQLDKANLDDGILKRQVAIIRSMTQKERKNSKILNGSRRKRIASGAGVQVQDVNRLIKQFEQTQQMMKKFGKMGQKGLMRNGLKGLLGR